MVPSLCLTRSRGQKQIENLPETQTYTTKLIQKILENKSHQIAVMENFCGFDFCLLNWNGIHGGLLQWSNKPNRKTYDQLVDKNQRNFFNGQIYPIEKPMTSQQTKINATCHSDITQHPRSRYLPFLSCTDTKMQLFHTRLNIGRIGWSRIFFLKFCNFQIFVMAKW